MTGKTTKDEKKDEKPVELDPGSKIILDELEKHLEKCVGAHCDQMRKELRTEIQSGKLDEAAIKRVTEDLRAKLGSEIKIEYTEPIKAMNNRMAQYGQKLDKQGEEVKMAVEENKRTALKIDQAVKEISGIKEVVKAPMGRLEELEKSKLQSEKALADASKAALEKAEAEKAKAAAAPPVPALAPTPHNCPNCDYDITKPKPKIAMACPNCHTSFTKYETDPPAHDDKGNPVGGQGYKNCSTCGTPLVPAQALISSIKKKAPAPAPAPAQAPAAPQQAAAQPKAL